VARTTYQTILERKQKLEKETEELEKKLAEEESKFAEIQLKKIGEYFRAKHKNENTWDELVNALEPTLKTHAERLAFGLEPIKRQRKKKEA
jgi:DNA-binding protein H-NS